MKVKRCAYCDRLFELYRNRGIQKYCSPECARAVSAPVDYRVFDHGTYNGATERDSRSAPRAQPKPLEIRQVTAQGRRYVALDADAFLESLSDSEEARPGHVYG